jgi:glycogen operon protein
VADRLNHWGYMTTNFFAPETRYASQPGRDVVELKQLVQAFHDRGIAVILDTVYNHTGEGSPFPDGNRLAAKYYNFRGLNNVHVYKSTPDGRFYFNNTGTGNDVDFRGGDRTFTKHFTTESLELWYKAYGIDGFRFDLARILADGSDNAADWVDNDGDFAAAHLHAEPWDMGGAWFDFMDNYGWDFHNNRWTKWLGKYRDDIRHFSKSTLQNRTVFKRLIEGRGDAGNGGPASTKPWRSVNFLAVHDGYTLRDCVSFNDSDGSHNCWDSNGDENLRRERQKLLLGILLTSQGVPLILQGDEFGQTKAGALSQGDAHNTYNYESASGDARINRVNWIDWRLKDGDNAESPRGPTYGKELCDWTRRLIQLRKQWTHFRRAEFADYAAAAFDGGADSGAKNDGRFSYSFEGPADGQPTQLAVIWWGQPGEPDLMVAYNESDTPFTVNNLNDWSQGDWKILARSWFGDNLDFGDLDAWPTQAPNAGLSLELQGRSLAILISDND